MRIVHFSDSFYPLINGVSNVVINTVSCLAGRGYEVMVVAPKPADKKITERVVEEKLGFGVRVLFRPSFPVLVYPKYRLGAPSSVLTGQVKKFNPDVIHFHTTLTLGLEALMTASFLKKPLIGSFHTYFMEPESMRVVGLRNKGRMVQVLNKILWGFAHKYYRRADVVIAPTKFVASDLKKRWKQSVFRVVPGGVDVESFSDIKNRDNLRTKYGLSSNFVLLWVGRLSYEKSLEVLIGAVAELSLRRPGVRLVLVGDGPARRELEFYASALGISDKIVFLGEKKYDDIVAKNYYSLADIFVTASTFETQGLSINEAMAAGLPVVGARSRAVPDLIRDCGLLSKPDDPVSFAKNIDKLIKNDNLRKKFAVKAREKAKIFSVKSSVDELVSVYEQVIKSKT